MAKFPEVLAREAAKKSLDATLLVFMDFRDTPRRWWMGFGPMAAGGHSWVGMGRLIQIEGLETAVGMTAPATTFTLSGVDPEIVALVRGSSERVKGRRVRVFLQFFAPPETGLQAWTPLDQPISIWSGIMDQLRYSGEGPTSRTVTLTAESLWTNRNRPAYGRLTDGDQRARHPGDRGLEEIAGLATKTIRDWVD